MDPGALKTCIERLLSSMGEEAEVSVRADKRTVVDVSTTSAERLIGAGGEALRALNLLARKLVELKHGEEAANFIVDINGYQEKKLEVLRQSARMLAQRARLFKHEVEMPPQSAYERLVVHELFAEDPEIATESRGEGKFRHIVLKYTTQK
ncbi:MAG: hypothetical protein KGI70_01365 [Patescibacteria group bacterium]|nr:hypothetical protein [Patescibacteria group bacterium]